jgi:hypothetical protein
MKNSLLWRTPVGMAILGVNNYSDAMDYYFGEIVTVLKSLHRLSLQEAVFQKVVPIERGKYLRVRVIAQKTYENLNYLVDLYVDVQDYFKQVGTVEQKMVFRQKSQEYSASIAEELKALQVKTSTALRILKQIETIEGAVDEDVAWIEMILLRVDDLTPSDLVVAFFDHSYLFGES